VAILFVAWASAFLYRASFIAFDGLRYFPLFDDALISMRYARNLAHADGLVWNAGERVEGYTNLLMVLVMAIPNAVTDQRLASFAVQLLGVATVVGVGYLALLLSAELSRSSEAEGAGLPAVVTFAAVLAYYPLSYWTLMGMETGLLTLLLLGGVLLAVRAIRRESSGLLMWVSLFLGLAYLARPDALVPALLVFAFVFRGVQSWQGKRPRYLLLFGVCALYALFPVGQLIFRWLYYGELVPNTYVLKMTGVPLPVRLENGLAFLQPFLLTHAALLITGTVSVLRKPASEKTLFLGIALVLMAYQVWVGGDPWSYWRILTPGVVFLIILNCLEITSWMRAAVRRRASSEALTTWTPLQAVTTAVLVATVLVLATSPFLPEQLLRREAYQTLSFETDVNRAMALREIVDAADHPTVGVVRAGTLPYYSGFYAIDFLGKSDKYIARLPADLSGSISWAGMTSVPGHNKYDLDYSLRRLRPTFVDGWVMGRQDLSTFAKSEYVLGVYKQQGVILLKGSPAVAWDRVLVSGLP
jgi:arabinofuranosyltransferase